MVEAPGFPAPTSAPYRTLRESIHGSDDVHKQQKWHSHGQRRQPNPKELRTNHRHFDGFAIGDIEVAYDRVRPGRPRVSVNLDYLEGIFTDSSGDEPRCAVKVGPMMIVVEETPAQIRDKVRELDREHIVLTVPQ
jgi:hypothetical protein